MTSLDKDSFRVSSTGTQAQSQRHTSPSFSLSKVGRHSRECVFISEEHIRCQRLCRESPLSNNYQLPSTLNPYPQIKFGTSTRGSMPPGVKMDDPGDISTNDALGCMVDTQPFKYVREPEIIIGTDARGKLKDAELIRNHSAAFYSRDSPGPAAIGGEFGPDFVPTKPRMAMARPFGQRLNQPDWMAVNDQPAGVGPGRYPRKDVSVGPQYLTHRRNQNVHAFPKAAKFPRTRNADCISLLDAAKSCFGKQVLNKNKSEPSINFNADSRDTKAKTMLCLTKLDAGPKAFMPKPQFSMPQLPSETSVMRAGCG